RQATHGRVLAVVQPHRYTRLRDLFDEFCTAFNHADYVLVAPVYEAGETPIEGFDRDTLIEGLRGHGHRHAQAIGGAEDLAAVLSDLVRSEDLIICLGAGSITHWANDLVQNLNRLEGAR
ncbi:MAG: glutamate ligase domain-containing protein, partial [Alphaproteobacteria bacterium]